MHTDILKHGHKLSFMLITFTTIFCNNFLFFIDTIYGMLAS